MLIEAVEGVEVALDMIFGTVSRSSYHSLYFSGGSWTEESSLISEPSEAAKEGVGEAS